jgi:tripartite-type tricarboxylate transporter receptor subunit TctC
MTFSRRTALALLAALALAPAWAQTYPTKPVRLIVPFPAGTGPDIHGRLLAQKLSDGWNGTGVVVDNKPGAGGVIAAGEAARAPADGYTLLMGLTGNMVIAPASYNKLPYNPGKDFIPVSQVVSNDFVLLMNPAKVPAKNLREYVAWGTKQPQGIFMGTFGAGTPGHFGAYIFGDAAKIKTDAVHYKNTGDAINGLIAGDVQGIFSSVGAAVPLVKAGRLAAVAATGPTRNSALPDVPTMKEQGFNNLEITSWFGIFVPAGTPNELVNKLNADIQAVLKQPDTQAKIEQAGFTAAGGTRDEFTKLIANDTAVWGKAVRATGFKAD